MACSSAGVHRSRKKARHSSTVLERQHGGEQAALGERLLAGGDVAVLFH